MITVYHGSKPILRQRDPTLFVRHEESGVTIQFGAESVSFRQLDDGDIIGETRGTWDNVLRLIRVGLPWVGEGEEAPETKELPGWLTLTHKHPDHGDVFRVRADTVTALRHCGEPPGTIIERGEAVLVIVREDPSEVWDRLRRAVAELSAGNQKG